MTDLISKGEIALHNYEDVCKVVDILLAGDYVVMVSREESLYIINYIWSQYCDRNDVVFMDRWTFEDKYEEVEDEEDEEEIHAAYLHDAKMQEQGMINAWNTLKCLITASDETVEEIFGVKEMSDEEEHRFWSMYPHQLPWSYVVSKVDMYKALQRAKYENELADQSLQVAMDHWDQMNEEEYKRKTECPPGRTPDSCGDLDCESCWGTWDDECD